MPDMTMPAAASSVDCRAAPDCNWPLSARAHVLRTRVANTCCRRRSEYFITTKIPAGFGGAAACKADPAVALATVCTTWTILSMNGPNHLGLHLKWP